MSEEVFSYNDEDYKRSLSLHKQLYLTAKRFLGRNIHSPSSQSQCYEYTVLILLCLLQSSMMYSNNMIIGLEHPIMQVMQVDHTQYGILYSAEMYPNIFIPLIGGILVDRVLGMRVGLLIATSIILFSQVVLATGAFVNLFWTMVLGRVVMGFGTEVLLTVIYGFKSVWFKHYLTFALAIGFTGSRIGATVAIFIPQYIFNFIKFIPNMNYRLSLTMSSSSVFMAVGLLCTIIIVLMDLKKERSLNKKEKDISKPVFRNFSFSDLKDFSFKFWLLFLALSLYYATIFSFIAYGQLLFINKFQFSATEASLANSIAFLGVIFVNLIIGKLIDLYGFNFIWCIAGVGLNMSALVLVISFNEHFIPYLIGIINGLGYSCFATGIWPIVPYIIQEHQLNTAYGILNCTCLGPIIAITSGVIIDNHGYLIQEIYYLILFLMACFCLVFLTIVMGIKLK